jgi:hypothetical protein
MDIVKSKNKNKRFTAIFRDGSRVNFGSNGSTYIDHGDNIKRINYLKRHKVNEDWTNPKTAGALSAYILWGSSKDINKNIQDYKKRFNLI